MHQLKPAYISSFSGFLRDLRYFLHRDGLQELETPLLNPSASIEAHLDCFAVQRPKQPSRKTSTQETSETLGYLISSPEYRLKSLLRHCSRGLFQIAHCFRSEKTEAMLHSEAMQGSTGVKQEAGVDFHALHMEEFLMLEWYLIGADEFGLMEQCRNLLGFLYRKQAKSGNQAPLKFYSYTMRELLRKYANCTWDYASLRDRAASLNLSPCAQSSSSDAVQLQLDYRDLFFSIFLNCIETQLSRYDGPVFIYDYPPQLAALSRIEDGRARRFEIYWKGVELANAYYELRSYTEYRERFAQENHLRSSLAKAHVPLDSMLMQSLREQPLPSCSGIALGLDRLFMLLMDKDSFYEIYDFYS